MFGNSKVHIIAQASRFIKFLPPVFIQSFYLLPGHVKDLEMYVSLGILPRHPSKHITNKVGLV